MSRLPRFLRRRLMPRSTITPLRRPSLLQRLLRRAPSAYHRALAVHLHHARPRSALR